MAQRVHYGLLGPVEVHLDGVPVALGGPISRAVLAALLIEPNRAVPLDRLVLAAWGEDARDGLRVQAQNRVSVLRRLLGDVGGGSPIQTTATGYRIRLGPGELDVEAFEAHRAAAANALQRAGRAPGRAALEAAVDELTRGLALWRGPAIDTVGAPWLRAAASRLDEARLNAREQRIELLLRLGRHADVIGELGALVAEHPWNERLVAHLMTALYRAGRQREALETFEQVRVRLTDDLGIDPARELAELRDAIVRGDPPQALPSPVSAPTTPSTSGAGVVVPAQLPPDVHGFTGRTDALTALDALVSDVGAAAAVVICAVSGTAGVGKTTLAVHWAHRVTDRFPDGQLYVNLRGFDPSRQAMDPTEAVRDLLEALGVAPDDVPAGLAAQTGLYRSLLAGKRVLLVLDNARDAEQVRALLPGSPGCLVVVTSRSQLTALLATHDARLLLLDALPAGEAAQLLAGRIGADRVDSEPQAVAEIISRCARLPLALAIVAAKAATHPGFPLRALADELCQPRGGLDAFTGADVTIDVRTVFSWSYDRLSVGAARLFRLLGLHPGPDIAVPAVASLAGAPASQVKPLLDELAQSHLIVEPAPGRYTLHDLLLAYATELVHTIDGEPDRRAAVQRMLDHYLQAAYTGSVLLYPHRYPIAPPATGPGVTLVDLSDHAGALAWFARECPVLLAAIHVAVDTGHDAHAWQLAWSTWTYLDRRGSWEQHATAQHLALPAAQRLGDPVGQAHSHHLLGGAYTFLHRYDQAHAHYEQAIDLFDATGDQVGRAHSHLNRALTFEHEERHDDALHQAQQSLDLFRAADHRSGQAKALNSLGWYQARLGRPAAALANCRQALDLLDELGDRYGQALTWDSLGYIYHLLGDHLEARLSYQRSVDLWQKLGDRHNQAAVLQRLAESRHAAGDQREAELAWRHALAILDDLAHSDADEVRDKLARISGTTSRTAKEWL